MNPVKRIVYLLWEGLLWFPDRLLRPHPCHGGGKAYLCTIVKNENSYLREFIGHYKALGFAKVILFDNNDTDGEYPQDVLVDFSDFVTVVPFRGRKECQLQAYRECYEKYGCECDWMAFFDADEFLVLNRDHSIVPYLSRDIFRRYDYIHINWEDHGDNGHLNYEDAPLSVRFPEATRTWMNNHVKTIARTRLHLKFWHPHTPKSIIHPCCNNAGTSVDGESPFCEYDDSYAKLVHYHTKSTEEFIAKLKRGYPDRTIDREFMQKAVDCYFTINEDSARKREMINTLFR